MENVVHWQVAIIEGVAMRFRVDIDPKKCVGCGNCVKSCAYGVLEIIDDLAYPVEPENCRGCKDCLEECEAAAISVIHI